MKVNDRLIQQKIYLKELKEITPKTKRKLKVYIGVDMDNFYYLLVDLETKSRFLVKNAKEIIDFVTPLSDIKFRKNRKIIFIESPICKKAETFLKENGWRVL